MNHDCGLIRVDSDSPIFDVKSPETINLGGFFTLVLLF